MPEQIYDNALTTVARVKTRLSISTSGHDTLLLYLINSATDFLQTQCNRTFERGTYTEVHSIPVSGAEYLFLKNMPVISITSIPYRAGLYDSPTWTVIPTTDYDMVEDGKSGMVRVESSLLRGTNKVQAVYVAGYLIDFTNYGDRTLHTLPADLTELCEKIVVRWFKKREAEGKTEEIMGTSGGGTIKWQNGLNKEDIAILATYKRMPRFL